MSNKAPNVAFLAEQVAGSCRIEGIQVSKKQLERMQQVIAGQLNAAELRAQLVKHYSQTVEQ